MRIPKRFPLASALALVLAAPVAGSASAAEPASTAVPATAEITPAVAARLDDAVRTAAGTSKGRAPAISVAVVTNGRLAYVRAFGVADLTSHRPATPETRFRIASVTKMLTAVAVMQLVQGGRVRLDAPLATYLPSAPHARDVTVRQLLMHTSGVWNYGDEAIRSGRVAAATTPAEIVAWTADRPLDQTPGAKFDYSNTGYVLLGLVVEAVARQPLAAYEAEHIFTPAGMRETTFGDAPAGAPRATGYMSATGTPALAYSPTWFYADGDAVSTASDVARFDIALMSGRLVSPAIFAEMQSSAVDAASLGAGVRYGLGLTLVPYRGMTLVEHHGGVPGFEAENFMLPGARFAAVVLSDAFDFPTSVVSGAVLREAFPSLAESAAPAASGEDPAITARLRAFLTQLPSGHVDTSSFTPEMAAAMTPAVVGDLAARLSPLGELRSLTFRGQDTVQVYRRYHYSAAYSGGQTIPLTLVLDANGKVAGFQPS
ncbi:MAG TPA: serine hydrolase [Candidatus Elarobacter sp.]|jgi:CubicO group peptidase (beta-lactamase class C family)|nr:serine hydrolase [Candidatus Elarobacter sp.]